MKGIFFLKLASVSKLSNTAYAEKCIQETISSVTSQVISKLLLVFLVHFINSAWCLFHLSTLNLLGMNPVSHFTTRIQTFTSFYANTYYLILMESTAISTKERCLQISLWHCTILSHRPQHKILFQHKNIYNSSK